MRPGDLTWDEAERRWPGCSAAWDVTSSKFRGQWQIDALYENYFSMPVVFVTGDDPGGLLSDDPKCHRAYFSYDPTHERWYR